MRFRLLAFALPLLLSGSRISSGQVMGLTSLRAVKHLMRPLLIFAPGPEDPRLEIQLRALKEGAPEASDRDLLALALPYNNPSPTEAYLAPAEAQELRRHFHVAPEEFLVVLLGKDGGAKLRSDKPISMQKLANTIDAMPMRQEEMKTKP